jgi:hypothetical protein
MVNKSLTGQQSRLIIPPKARCEAGMTVEVVMLGLKEPTLGGLVSAEAIAVAALGAEAYGACYRRMPT